MHGSNCELYMTTNRVAHCPCCHEKMLRHISRNRFYWFCIRCRQRMSSFKENTNDESSKRQKYKDKKIAR